MIYEDEHSNYLHAGQGVYGIMSDQMIAGVHEFRYLNAEPDDTLRDTYLGNLVDWYGGIPVNKDEATRLEDSHWVSTGLNEGEFITWVAPFDT
jgi:hypothetical protein